jgi:excinuclease ABC subunit C
MRIPEPICIQTRSGNLDKRLFELRKIPGVYSLNLSGTPLHLSWSTNLERRLSRLLNLKSIDTEPPAGSLRSKIDLIECWPCGSRLELSLTLYELAKKLYPGRYARFLKLRIPWFLRLIPADGFARLETTNRPSTLMEAAAWGPFSARGIAQAYEQEVLGLFQIRRCVETLAPALDHPGCIYGEMSQCLRPCQLAVTSEQYSVEVSRVSEFLRSNGRSPIAAMSAARERASEDLQFEAAAQAHKRVEKMKAAASLRPPVVGSVQNFSGLALVRGQSGLVFWLWPLVDGFWQDPISIDVAGAARSRSLDSELRELVMARIQAPEREGNRAEALALFSRWYYSSWRDGEWFPFEKITDLNYRRLVRTLSKMAQSSSEPAGEH